MRILRICFGVSRIGIGELLKEIPDKKASSGAGTRSLPAGITKKLSHYCQRLAARIETGKIIFGFALDDQGGTTKMNSVKIEHSTIGKMQIDPWGGVANPQGPHGCSMPHSAAPGVFLCAWRQNL